MLKDNEISVTTNTIKVGGRVLPKYSAFFIVNENRWACFLGEKDEPFSFIGTKLEVLQDIAARYPTSKINR